MKTKYNNDIRVMKLKQMILSRFGKGLEFQALTPLTLNDSLTHQPRLQGHNYLIPLYVNEAYLGTAVIPEAKDLNDESQMQISQAVRLIMEPLMYRDYLSRIEDNMRTTETPNAQVLHFQTALTAIENSAHPMTSHIIHFFGKTGAQKQKATDGIHELSQHWAQVNAASLAQGAMSLTELKSLGATTLVVEDIAALKDRRWIEEYARLAKREQNLLLVLCSEQSADELRAEALISESLYQSLLPFSLNTDRAPVNEFRLKQVLLHLFMT